MTQSEKTPEELRGIKAIQFLQKLSGVDETEEQATKGWRRMTEEQRARTFAAFHVCGGKFDD